MLQDDISWEWLFIGFLIISVVSLYLYVSYLHGRIQKQSEMTGHIIAALNRLEQEIRQK